MGPLEQTRKAWFTLERKYKHEVKTKGKRKE